MGEDGAGVDEIISGNTIKSLFVIRMDVSVGL
jgi:hypothetical protein